MAAWIHVVVTRGSGYGRNTPDECEKSSKSEWVKCDRAVIMACLFPSRPEESILAGCFMDWVNGWMDGWMHAFTLAKPYPSHLRASTGLCK